MQNLEFGRNSAPQEAHAFPDCCCGGVVCLGINAGSGDGNVPTSPNASCAETIPGGASTYRILCSSRSWWLTHSSCHHSRLTHSWHQTRRLCITRTRTLTAFLNSKITLIAKNSNAEYATV